MFQSDRVQSDRIRLTNEEKKEYEGVDDCQSVIEEESPKVNARINQSIFTSNDISNKSINENSNLSIILNE